MYPLIKKISKELKISFEEVPTHEIQGKNHANKYNITMWPYILLIENNIIKEEILGYDTMHDEEFNRQKLIEIITEVFNLKIKP